MGKTTQSGSIRNKKRVNGYTGTITRGTERNKRIEYPFIYIYKNVDSHSSDYTLYIILYTLS
jgi:hypothetical protein